MGFRLREKDDIKTFILYLLLQIDRPIDIATLNDIAVSDDFVNQFDFMDAFYELARTDAIKKEVNGKTELYSITNKGREAASLLEGNIVSTIKERSAYSAMKLLSFKRTGAAAKSVVIEENGKYILSCSVNTADGKIMSVDISFDSEKKAAEAKNSFDEKPEFIYRAILGVVSGDINYLAESWIHSEDEDLPPKEEEEKTPEPSPQKQPKKISDLFKKTKK